MQNVVASATTAEEQGMLVAIDNLYSKIDALKYLVRADCPSIWNCALQTFRRHQIDLGTGIRNSLAFAILLTATLVKQRNATYFHSTPLTLTITYCLGAGVTFLYSCARTIESQPSSQKAIPEDLTTEETAPIGEPAAVRQATRVAEISQEEGSGAERSSCCVVSCRVVSCCVLL